jgi:hypothetical protein
VRCPTARGGERGLWWPPIGQKNDLGRGSPVRGGQRCLRVIFGEGNDSGDQRHEQKASGNGGGGDDVLRRR